MTIKRVQDWHQLPPVVLPSPVFALTSECGGIWAGGEGGVAWYAVADQLWQPRISGLVLSSATALVYADGWLIAGSAEGIARSKDGGLTWQLAELEDGAASIMAFAVSPHFAEDRTALAATLANGVLRTDDGGRTWKNVAFGLETFEVTALAWGDGSTILAATADGIYRSPNAGRAWRLVHESAEMVVEAIAYLPDGSYLATLEKGGLLRSSDGGTHWLIDDSTAETTQGMALFVTPAKTLLLGTLQHGLSRSTDNGRTWQKVSASNVLSFTVCDGAIYAGTSVGVMVSPDDGTSWQDIACPPVHDLRHLLLHKDQILLTGTYTTIAQLGPDQTWQVIPDLPLPLTAVASAPDGTLLLSSPGGLMRWDGTGSKPQTLIQDETGFVVHISFIEHNGTWHAWAGSADGKRLLRSYDDGRTWQPLPAPFGVLPLAALLVTPDRLIAATYDPRQYRAHLWYSTDGGETWEHGLEAETMWPIVTACQHPPLITMGDILFSRQQSGYWNKITVGNDNGAIRHITSVPAPDGSGYILFVLTTTGIQRSDDEGATWIHDDAGLPIEQVIDIAATDNTLYILLAGGRVWTRSL